MNELPLEEFQLEVPTDGIELYCESGSDDPEPWLYRAKNLLPGTPANKKLCGCFFFLVLGRYLPVLDFLTDIGSAGFSCI